ncbi:hypothetical protein [Phytoactinopolyspora endophytica]|uniref:hypothetical protein n=1 Tax=Phytoactinopolyspora endophytica TaxID=1642495 RepID=UPI00101DEFEE|nr:hypothetical protein [Phytoactinopolyspora endophytica]
MDITDTGRTPGPSFVPDACTLPTAEQPLRVTEFADMFATAVHRIVRTSATELHLILDGYPATEATARELAARETDCCSFFTFTFHPARVGHAVRALEVTVTVPAAHVAVLDGLQHLAETVVKGSGPA